MGHLEICGCPTNLLGLRYRQPLRRWTRLAEESGAARLIFVTARGSSLDGPGLREQAQRDRGSLLWIDGYTVIVRRRPDGCLDRSGLALDRLGRRRNIVAEPDGNRGPGINAFVERLFPNGICCLLRLSIRSGLVPRQLRRPARESVVNARQELSDCRVMRLLSLLL